MADTLRERVLTALQGQGLDNIRQPGDHHCPHSWRCENSDRYPDYCMCLDEAVDAVLEAIWKKVSDDEAEANGPAAG